jgi:hypothetical protein
MDWDGIKHLAQWSIEKDALHIYAAFAVQVAAAALLRRPLSSWLPWVCVLVIELINESMDIFLGEEAQVHEWQLRGAQHDILNTMALPTMLLLLVRYANRLFQRSEKVGPSR